MDEKEFTEQLEKLTDKEDISAIEAFANSLSPSDLALYKNEIAAGYTHVFHLWYYDIICHKVNVDKQEEVINEMFEIITLAQKITPEYNYNREKAQCYELLAGLKTEKEDKLVNVQKVIDEYLQGLERSETYRASLANALLDRMLLTEDFSDDEFQKILDLFVHAFETYTEAVLSSFIYGSFRILAFPFPKAAYWHEQFINKYNAALTLFAKNEPIIYFAWADVLVRAIEYKTYNISDEYADELQLQALALLEHITDYPTDKPNLLNQLGFAFEKAAKRMPATMIEEKLRFFDIALAYFTKGQLLEPATWTFPVYATNVLKAKAVIYHNSGKSVTRLFELGRTHFARVIKHEEDFTLNLYWGEFLIEYARLAYNFDAPEILQEATAKSLLAKELGRGFYSQPFFLLAKIALKTGKKEACMEILRECKSVFSTAYYVYDLAPVLRDPDFKEIWEDPLLIPE